MGKITRALQQQRRAGQQPSFIPTQLGDHEFSLASTPSSQAQYPAAASEYRFFQNQRLAQNRLADAQQFGIDTSGDDFDQLNQAANVGFTERALTLGESLIGWIDGPRQFMNLLIQDLVGGEAAEGFQNPNFSDYLDAFWSGIDDPEEMEARTGLTPHRGSSQTFDMFGWEEEESFLGRAVRGVADFGFQIAIDPISWFTGGLSGMGKRMATSAAKNLQKDAIEALVTKGVKQGKSFKQVADELPDSQKYFHSLAERGDDLVEELMVEIQELGIKHGGDLPKSMDDALAKYLGEEGSDALFDNLTEIAIARAVGDDVLKPIARRDFLGMNQLAREELPKWARGGLRITAPFMYKTGIAIPGTVGLGRKLVGNPMRAVSEGLKKYAPGYKPLAAKLDKLGSELIVDRELLRAIGKPVEDGGLTAWQYYVAAPALDLIHNTAERQKIIAQLNAKQGKLVQLAKAAGIEDAAIFDQHILNRLQGANIGGDMLEQIMGHMAPALAARADIARAVHGGPIDDAINDLVQFTAKTFDEYHQKLSVLDPSVKEKYIDGYVPYRANSAGRNVISELAIKGGAIQKRLLQKAQQEGNPAYSILARIIAADSEIGRLDMRLGGSGHFNEASYTRQQALRLSNAEDGALLIDEEFMGAAVDQLLKNGMIDPNAMSTKSIPVSVLNEILEAPIREVAEEFGIKLPKDWNGKYFNENPMELLTGYVGSLEEAIGVWGMMEGLQTAGLAFRHDTGLAVHPMIQSVMANMVRRADKMTSLKGFRPLPGLNHMPTDTAMTIADGKNLAEVNGRKRPNGVMLRDGTMGTFDELKEEIAQHGIETPILVAIADNGEAFIQDGHHRLVAAKELGIDEIPFRMRTETEPFYTTGVNWNEFRRPGFVSGKDAGGATKWGTPVDADEAFHTLPWGPKGVQEDLMLRGFDKTMNQGIPMPVITALKNEGLPVDVHRIHETRELLEMARMSKDDFMSMTPNAPKNIRSTAPFGKGVTHRMRTTVDRNDVFIDVELAPATTSAGQADNLLDAMVALDASFKTGALKGRYSPRLIRDLLENPEISEQTAEVLFEYNSAKMMGLPDRVKEFFSGEAAEVFDTRILFNTFEEAWTDFTQKVAAIQSQGGSLARISQYDTATEELLRDLQNMKNIARKLGDRGYDELVKVFKGADVFTNLSTHDGFVSPGKFGLAGPAVDNLVLHSGMAAYVRNVARGNAMMHTPEGVAAAKLAAKEGLRWWRAMATIARPTFHIRNLIGGSWMNMHAGVRSQDYQRIALNVPKFRKALMQSRAAGEDAFEEALKELPQTEHALFRAMWEEDILSGFVSTEFRKLAGSEKNSILNWLKVWDVDNFAMTKIGGNTMQSIEDLLRASLFARYFDEASPGSAKVARDAVNAIHFDYVNLTPLETRIKSVVPFFVWTKNNIPRQLEMAVENPVTVQKYRAMMQAMSDNFGGSTETLPEGDHFGAYAAGTDYYVNENTPFWARAILDPDLPINDLLELPWPEPGALMEWAGNLLGPHISIISDINEQRDWGDVNAPAPLHAVLQSLAAVGLYDETTDGDVRIPYLMRTIMETGMPMARETMTPLMGGPGDPNRQQRLGIGQGEPEWMQALKTLGFGTLAGAGIKLTTPADARGVAARSGDELDTLIQNLRLQGLLPPSQG